MKGGKQGPSEAVKLGKAEIRIWVCDRVEGRGMRAGRRVGENVGRERRQGRNESREGGLRIRGEQGRRGRETNREGKVDINEMEKVMRGKVVKGEGGGGK